MFQARCFSLAGCLSVMMLCGAAAQPAVAANVRAGTITFVGAIVESTCRLAAEPASLIAVVGEVGVHGPVPRMCSNGAHESAHASRVYSASVVRLTSTESDRVLAYFDHYVKAESPDAADPVLVTQTYE